MNLKKIMVTAMAGLCLVGCSGGKSVPITPVPNSSSLKEIMPEKTYNMMTNVYGTQFINLADMLNYVGEDVTDVTFNTLEGKALKLGDLKGKNVVVEVVANWCTYCQEQEKTYSEALYKANPDTVFVQLFAEGNPDEVKEFFNTAGKEPGADYVIPATNSTDEGSTTSEAVLNFLERAGIMSYPTFVMIDDTGKISWTYAGIITSDQFPILTDAAYGDVKIYETFDKETLDLNALNRTTEDVKNDLSDEAESLIEAVETNADNLSVLYMNLGRKFFDVTFTDINGETVDTGDLKGKKFIFEILTVDETNYTGSKTSTKNLEKFKDNNYTYVQFWLPSAETADIAKYLKQNKIDDVADYVIGLDNETNNVEELMEIDVYNFPTQFFIDKDFRIAGVTQGAMTEEKFDAAVKAFYGRTPLYNMGEE